jgi:hypothetical protein
MKGVKREGVGRKPGVSKATLLKRSFPNYFTEGNVLILVNKAKPDAMVDSYLLKFVLERIFDKAPQSIEMTGKDGTPLFDIAEEMKGIKTAVMPNENKRAIFV